MVGGWDKEKGETRKQAAAREAKEEAGLSGKIVKELGHWTEDKPNKKHNTDSNDIIYYEMDVTDVDSGFLEKSERELKWVTYKEAIDLASNEIVREAIEKSSLSSDIAKL
ncbi:hypothetical protein IWQ60_004692 [Tieghemiomyces parasiticus]|uniref:Nudix hydrolase domain-containing protein n=1 Tax=Tieghemiomyces parasiticus TaxID=78921 RepID=A0A9W8DZ51_9FUNG|nr:hypothetical protein IWQ60_004692 [Tieghemiomyces parasiticus]